MAQQSPTSRSLKVLREEGWLVQVVERFCHWSKRRIDLFSIGDILGIHPDVSGTLIIQCTSQSNKSSRWQKLIAAPESRIILQAGNKLELWTWAKRGKKGVRKLWELQRTPVTPEDLPMPSNGEE